MRIILSPYLLANKKWIAQYVERTENGKYIEEVPFFWEKQFSSRFEANKYAVNYLAFKATQA